MTGRNWTLDFDNHLSEVGVHTSAQHSAGAVLGAQL